MEDCSERMGQKCEKTPQDFEELKQHTNDCEHLQVVRQHIQIGWPEQKKQIGVRIDIRCQEDSPIHLRQTLRAENPPQTAPRNLRTQEGTAEVRCQLT